MDDKKIYKHICFDPVSHTYRNLNNNSEYISVTTLLKDFKEPFDIETHSKRVALREGVSQEEIKKRWEDNTKDACNYGTELHKVMEDYSLGLDVKEEKYEPLLASFEALKYNQFIAEQIIFNDDVMVAGQADGWYIKDNKLCIIDYKTNRKGINKTNSYGKKMLHFLKHLDDCKYNEYSLQLTIYALMLSKMTNMEIGQLDILYIPEKNNKFHLEVIPVVPLIDEAREILNSRFLFIKNGRKVY